MPKPSYPDLNKSLRENAQVILPQMFDDFMQHKSEVIRHPRSVRKLHEMRIKGKALRYTLEVFGIGYGKEFKACYSEVKRLIDRMGRIHDCDVAMQILHEFLDEMRSMNGKNSLMTDGLSAKSVRDLLVLTQGNRNRLFSEYRAILNEWRKTNFRKIFILSLR